MFTFYHLCGSLSKGFQVGWYKQVCVTSWFSGLLLHSQSAWKAAYLKINFKISPKTPTVNHSFLYFIQCHWNKKGLSKKGDKNDHREWILMSKQKYMLTEFEVRRAGFYRCSASNWKIWPWASKMLYLLTIPALQHTFNPNVVIQSFWNLFLSL